MTIDQHNRDRQDPLDLKNKLGRLDWSQHMNIYIILMTVVDTWQVGSQCADTNIRQKQSYSYLVKKLIENAHDNSRDSCIKLTSEDLSHNVVEFIDCTGIS